MSALNPSLDNSFSDKKLRNPPHTRYYKAKTSELADAVFCQKSNNMPRYKSLKSVAHNFGQSFISLLNYMEDDYFMEHLARQARKTGCHRLNIAILKNYAAPPELLTDPIKQSIEHCNNWFPTFVEDCGSSMAFIHSAIMTIEFDFEITRANRILTKILESPFTCEVVIVDDRNNEYKYLHKEWWTL